MALVRPRLTDYHDILVRQEELDFAIPFLDEDLPFCVDPFLLWKSPSQQDNALHTALVNSVNYIGLLAKRSEMDTAIEILVRSSECNEVGLGFSGFRRGKKIGIDTARKIVDLFLKVPQLREAGFTHLEEIQLLVDHISKDRISDIACTFLKSFLIDYTMEHSRRYGVPMVDVEINDIWNQRTYELESCEAVELPVNPNTGAPILYVPKRWLRKSPWIETDDFVKSYFLEKVLQENEECPSRGEILLYNRQNYGVVRAYVKDKERTQSDCRNDPLFMPIPVLSAKRKFAEIQKLPTGKSDNADRRYEDLMCQLMASLLYPHLDFAEEQCRTESGVLIRDLVFYNNRSVDFLQDILDLYGCRQIVMELKNVGSVDGTHINQLNRYLANEFGCFGIIITRSPMKKAILNNTVALWSAQRRCIIVLSDYDIEIMVNLFENRQRLPIEVLKKKFVEFQRICPK